MKKLTFVADWRFPSLLRPRGRLFLLFPVSTHGSRPDAGGEHKVLGALPNLRISRLNEYNQLCA
jgi:hypothetical protein